jgi:hypothetical protein
MIKSLKIITIIDCILSYEYEELEITSMILSNDLEIIEMIEMMYALPTIILLEKLK